MSQTPTETLTATQEGMSQSRPESEQGAGGAPTRIVVAEQIHKTFRSGEIEVHALRGVDLTIEAGEMVAIMGPSGCGKTTLLNTLSGLDSFDSGQVMIEGTSLADMNDRTRTDYRARRMGFVFQSFNLLPVISAVENVEMPLLVSGVRPAQARKRALESLDSVGLADLASHRPMQLSGGQIQRVAIARALVNNPALVWADEPTGNLDPETGEGVLRLLLALNQARGAAMVVVTHSEKLAAAMDRTLRLKNGMLTEVGRGDGTSLPEL